MICLNSTVSGNSTSGEQSDGGGIYTYRGRLSLANSVVSDNSTSGEQSQGGGIYSFGVSLTDSTVSGNSTTGAASHGGGISSNDGYISSINSTISGNSTNGYGALGGGINASYSGVYLTNSTVSSNSTFGELSRGGGILFGGNAYVGDDSSFLSVGSSTITGNSSAGIGGGIALGDGTSIQSASGRLDNSIVAGNTDNGTAPDILISANGSVEINHSLIGDTTGSGITATTGAGNILNQSALLGPLANNGGPTLTHALLDGSPAINAGDNTQVTFGDDFLLETDQRGEGFDRVFGSSVDIGAFELQLFVTPSPTIVSATINEGGVLVRPDLWNTLTVVFNTNVSVSADDLTLFNDSPQGIEIDLAGIGFNYDSSTSTAIWDFSPLDPVSAGFYTYRLDANSITSETVLLDGNGDGIRGDNFEDQIYVAIPGDANLDGRVDVLNDAFTLVSNLVTASGAVYADADFNGDGRVDILGDAFILVANLNRDVDLVTDVVVSNNTDLVNADTSSVFALIANDGGDGISLREAITASNNSIGSGTVSFDESVFNGGANSLIRLTQGELEITDGINIDASSAISVTITGDAFGDDATFAGTFITDVAASFGGTAGDAGDLLDDNSRVLNFSSDTGDLTLTDVTLTGGRTTGINSSGEGLGRAETTHNGGGIRFNSNGDLTLVSSTVSGNSVSGRGAYGGGVSSVSGSVALFNSTVSENFTSGRTGRGGGISTIGGSISLHGSSVSTNGTSGSNAYGGGVFTLYGNVSVSNSTISDNSTAGSEASGGGIFTLTGSVSLNSSSVSENSTSGPDGDGGGIFTEIGNVSAFNSNVNNNSTTGNGSAGGGIFNRGGDIWLTDSSASDNSTLGVLSNGGGIYSVGYGEVALHNSIVSGNSTSGERSDGGGIYTFGSSVSLTNSTISGNSVSGERSDGGGILAQEYGVISLTNSTVSGNSGGGIRTFIAAISLLNSTVTENTATGITVGDSVIDAVGGIEAGSGDVSIVNSIVAGNFSNISTVSPDLLPGTGNLVVEHSLIGDTTDSGITASTGTGNILNQPASARAAGRQWWTDVDSCPAAKQSGDQCGR